MQQIHTGKCPIINEERSITVNYIFVPILGTTTRNYKKSIFECSNEECPDPNHCPIYANAPDSVIG